MKILAIDPGPTQSGWCIYDTSTNTGVMASGISPNDLLLDSLSAYRPDKLAIEMIASYGMPVGAEVFETCVWIGRFMQFWFCTWISARSSVELIYRKDVKMFLCGTTRAKDANIRQRLLDLIGPQGTKKNPGPCYGVKSHAWPALAVAATVCQLQETAP